MRRTRFQPFQEEADEESLLNLTPLIDVVFIVLIAFILIAPLLQVDRVTLATTGAPHEMARELSSISIYIRKDGSIWLNGQPRENAELKQLLKDLRGRDQQKIAQLFPDKDAPFGRYQLVKDLLEESGFQEIALMLQPDTDATEPKKS